MLSEQQWRNVFDYACLSISAHNTQPACWRVEGDRLILTDDTERRLAVADSLGRDHRISLGASIYCMKISLSQYSYGLKEVSRKMSPSLRLEFQLEKKMDPVHPFLDYLLLRKSFRGKFSKAKKDMIENLKSYFANDCQMNIVVDRVLIKEVAKDYDRANYHFLSNDKYLDELYQWLRFEKKHKGFTQDGLNTDAMSLNAIEGFFAKYILSKNFFDILKKMKLAPFFISEESKVKSSTAICFLLVDTDMDDFTKGYVFMEKWLELTRLGMALTPLSCLSDWVETNEKWHRILQIEPDKVLLNVFRVGPMPKKMAGRCRLPIQEKFQVCL